MKTNILLLSILTLFLFWGCSEKNQIIDPVEKNEGSVQLHFEKAMIPQGVNTIVAFLTRDNYTTITGELNLTSSSTASVLIKNITPGVWHLKVNALDENGVVLYSGETDVNIQSGALTTASLVLNPMGQLLINVGWAVQTNLLDYAGNPILSKLNNGTDYGAYFGRVLYDEGKFKMWFANSYGSDKYDIGYAESADGLTWSVVKPKALEAGPVGSWDAYSVHPGAVIKDGSTYKMYYCGQSAPNDTDDKRVGLATSTDGINWTRSSLSTVQQIGIYGYTTDILKVNSTYYMYFGNAYVIGVATSTDGINWIKSSQSIVSATESWEGSRIWSCSVIIDDNKWKMVYTNMPYNSFGYAESTDGVNWTKKSTPIFTYSNTNNLWPYDIRFPFIRKVNNKYYLYYSTMSSSYEWKMGVATGAYLQ